MELKLIGPDRPIEAYLSQVVGVRYTYSEDIETDKVYVSDDHQVSRTELETADYIDAIGNSIRMGLPLRPVILHRVAKNRLNVLDGIHRVKGTKQAKRPKVAAYVIDDATPEELRFIATTANVHLNGQGLSEQERRTHFLDYLRLESPKLAGTDKSLRSQIMRKVCHALAISYGTAKRWTDVEVFKQRAQQLGLDLPPEMTASKHPGEKGDGWILAVSSLSDEELTSYWSQLLGAKANAVRKVTRQLTACTSTRQRADLAAQLFSQLHPTIRVLSQTEADKDRRKANAIRMHGAGLIKHREEFLHLAIKYQDVRTTLTDLYEALQSCLIDVTELSDRSAKSA